jgi:hypothetical protein
MTSALGPVLETVLAKAPPNPNDVVGGWVAFVVVVAMGAAVVFLYFSLKKQLGKVNFEEAPDPRNAPCSRPDPRRLSTTFPGWRSAGRHGSVRPARIGPGTARSARGVRLLRSDRTGEGKKCSWRAVVAVGSRWGQEATPPGTGPGLSRGHAGAWRALCGNGASARRLVATRRRAECAVT